MQHANDNSAPANAEALTFASVCSGIEAASVAFTPLGWRAVCFSEIEKFPSAVLAHHYPDVPNLGDFTKIDTRTLPRVDILCGGTPCQAFSVAGLRQSLDDARGNLSLEFVRLAHELADGNRLRNVVWENVPGVLSTKDNAFGCFLAGLVGATDALPPPKGRRWPNAGMVAGPKGRAAWVVKDAQYFGLAQRRKRVIVVADFGNGADPAAVLFEPEGVRRDSAPSREAGQGTSLSPSLRARANSSHRADSQAFIPEIARCDATREGSSQDYESTTMVAQVYSIMPQNSGKDYKARPVDVAQPVMAAGQSHGNQGGDVVCVTGHISHTLKAEGADASEDGTGRGTPIVAFALNSHAGCADGEVTNKSHSSGGPVGMGVSEELAYSLRAGRTQSVAQTVALRGREGGATAELGGDVATALRASSGGGDKPHVLTSQVRRLTPKECERLQGFKDNYTRIPFKRFKDGKKRITRLRPDDMWEQIDGVWWLMSADGPRYKALGNSWAVPLFNWLGARIQQHMPPIAANDNNKQDIALVS